MTAHWPPELKSVVGRRLCERRVACGLTLRDVAVPVGVSAQFLHEVEAGRKRLSPVRLGAALRQLGATVDDMLRGWPYYVPGAVR